MRDSLSLPSLEAALSAPSSAVIEQFAKLEGDLIFLGVAGKMGPSLARMAKRASDLAGKPRRIMGVSRFRDPSARQQLEADGIETLECDLLDAAAVAKLPDAPHVIYLAGMKFGATGNQPLTWAMNTHLPSIICQRYRHSRIAAFSTGNIYGLRPVDTGGAKESDAPNPLGEYAMSCLGRERMFEHFSITLGIPVVLIRLNYACDLRYGVMVDIAQKVWRGEPVDISMSWFNTIWQGDANAYSLLALDLASSPATHLNLTGPATLRVRDVAERFARRWQKRVSFTGAEAPDALLNDASFCFEKFGPPQLSEDELLIKVAEWIEQDGELLDKPTHFESRDGSF